MGMIIKFQSEQHYLDWMRKFKLPKGDVEIHIAGHEFDMNPVMWKKSSRLPINMKKVSKRL